MKYILPLIFSTTLLVSCSVSNTNTTSSTGANFQHIPGTVSDTKITSLPSLETLLKYKSAYIGDNSNTSNLFNSLLLSDQGKRIYKIIPDTRTVIVRYHLDTTLSDPDLQKALFYNSLSAFALIDNLTEIRYEIADMTYSITRSQMEHYFSPPLAAFLTPDTWDTYIIPRLQDTVFLNNLYARFSKQPIISTGTGSSH